MGVGGRRAFPKDKKEWRKVTVALRLLQAKSGKRSSNILLF